LSLEAWIEAKPKAEAAMQALDSVVQECRGLPTEAYISLSLARQGLARFRAQLEDAIGKAVQP
jgi:hypothetical protein